MKTEKKAAEKKRPWGVSELKWVTLCFILTQEEKEVQRWQP